MLAKLRDLAARLRAFVRPGSLDRDFTDELQSHIDMLTDENLRRGMTPEQARREARIRVGSATSLREQHRDVRGLPALAAMLQDLRFAFRLLARNRGYSAVAIAVLALGIGTNATGFSIVNAVFLRGLPYEHSDRLHVISWQNQSGRRVAASYSEFQEWRTNNRNFDGIAAYRSAEMNLSGGPVAPEEVSGTWITTNAFGVLGQRPAIGRDFTPEDERPDAAPVVIIGHEVWNRRYGGDASAIGQVLKVNGQPATIVGVMPKGQKFPEDSLVWAPLVPAGAAVDHDARALRVFGRLRDDTTRGQAATEMNGIARQIIAARPEAAKDLTGVLVETFTERFIGGIGRSMFLTVMGAVGLVLLIACANVANLSLSRSAARAREIAVRMALGATRGRVVRQLLVESLVLSVIAGGLGLLIAVTSVRAFAAMFQESGLPYWVIFDVDYVVFAYVAAICVTTAILFGLAPALHVSKSNGHEVLKESGRAAVSSVRIRRFGTAMVLTELALTTTLLVAAGLMIRSVTTLRGVDLGFGTDGLVTMRLRLPESKYGTPEARRAFFDRLEPRLATIPGVEAAAVTNGVPPNDGGERLLEVDGLNITPASNPVFVGTVTITPRFFEVLRTPVVRGRGFTEADGAPGADTVVVNERLADRFFPGQDPVGRRIRFTRRNSAPGQPVEAWRAIVGIVPTIKHGSPQDGYDNSVVYIPYRRETPAAASLLVRSSLPPDAIVRDVRREVQALDPDQPVLSIQTLTQVLAQTRWWWSTWSAIFGICAVIALVLSAVGLYAVIACTVSQRTQEIGVRMALGAQPLAVWRMILRRALVRLAIGLALGFAGAFVLSDILWSGGVIVVPPNDLATYTAIAALLSLVTIAAALLPARRATRIDPVTALRAD